MLIGKLVCLGPMLNADAGVVFNWHNSMDVMHLDGLYRPISQGNFDDWFLSIGKDPARVVFAIRKQGDLAFLGYVQITNIHPANHSAELGIMIGDPNNRDKGYGQEALRLSLEYCWKELNLQRLSLLCIGKNERALHVYQNVGFEIEGVLRRSIYINGGFQDSTVMGLLR